MSVQSNVRAWKFPSPEYQNRVAAGREEYHERGEPFDLEDHDSVSVTDSEFDNFTVDIRKLPPTVTHIEFYRG